MFAHIFSPVLSHITETVVMNAGDRVFKFGRSTGCTLGTLNAFDSFIKLPHFSSDVRQMCFVGGTSNFLERGDSGSWMLSTDGKLGALTFASNDLQQAYGTDIDKILWDIGQRLNCSVELPEEVD